MDEMQRPTATTASWEGPNTFNPAPVQVQEQEAAPADPTPSSWGSQEADAAQEAQAAENTGWFAYTSNPNAMDTTAGRGRARAEAKCHHCWQTGHTRRNCPNRDQPRRRKNQRFYDDQQSWINQYNNEDEPRRRLPQAAPRGRSPTVKPVHGSNVATYAPTTRYSPSRLELPSPLQRRAATPLPSPLPTTSFRSKTPFTAIQHPAPPRSPMTDEEFADRLAEMEIRRARAVKTQDWKAVQDLDFKANLAMAVRATMKKKPPTLEEIEEELQKTETRLARALINGTATDIRRLDCAANRMAEELMKRDVDYCPAMLTTANVLLQRGRCSRKEGNVTVSPSTVPRSPAKTPKNTAIRRSPSDIAEEETQVMRLVAESTRPTKAESRDYFITTMEALRDSWK
ncbi:hypothetical protein EDB84DRAFT_1565245 [Lactarius hengduanensis]|nr:hypothetical protein EDB84DRAFT_1565245 [Lactarius hengduanensis]